MTVLAIVAIVAMVALGGEVKTPPAPLQGDCRKVEIRTTPPE